ncbi:MAG: glycosyltransferase [Thermoanaerobaculum sp.]
MSARVVFLLEGTGVYGGVKVVFQQAELLEKQGFQVTVAGKEPAPNWFPVRVPYRYVPSFDPVFLPEADLTVATFWTTLEPALRLPWGKKVHYCQGFEGNYVEAGPHLDEIMATYRLPMPAWVVSPHLGELVTHRFGRPTFLLTPPLDPLFAPSPWKRRPRNPPRILVTGPFHFRWKGVKVALEAIRILRKEGFNCELWRVSPSPLSEDEARYLVADRFFHGLPSAKVARIVRQCDVLLATSLEEGFGLPVLESLASGVPVIASDIPAFRFVGGDAVRYVTPGDAKETARSVLDLFRSAPSWDAYRRAGLQRAGFFSASSVGPRLREAVRWALEDHPFRAPGPLASASSSLARTTRQG